MDGFVPTPEERRTILALRKLTYAQQRAFIDAIQALAEKEPNRMKVARLAAIFQFKRRP